MGRTPFCIAVTYNPGEGGSGDSRRAEAGRAHKKPRLVWTAELHARFMNAVNHLVRHSCISWSCIQVISSYHTTYLL